MAFTDTYLAERQSRHEGELEEEQAANEPKEIHTAPNHISKTVLPRVEIGPPIWMDSRTFTLRSILDL